jgi:hypothetical protein
MKNHTKIGRKRKPLNQRQKHENNENKGFEAKRGQNPLKR